MANPYLEIDAALTRFQSGERDKAVELLKVAVERGELAPTAYLLERLTPIYSPAFRPVVQAIEKKHGGDWLGPLAKRLLDGERDPRIHRDLKDAIIFQTEMSNQFAFVDEAIRRERNGDHQGARAAMRGLAARGGEAAVACLVDRLLEMGDPALMKIVDEIAESRGATWVGRRAQ
jgi:hypothetical protein